MYNTMGSGANKAAKPAQLQTFNWKKATAAPTVAPTRTAAPTPGRRPSCVSGPVIAVRGIGRVLSPAPLGDLHKENDFMWKVRTQMANKVTGSWTNADMTTSAGSGITIKPCDILVQDEGGSAAVAARAPTRLTRTCTSAASSTRTWRWPPRSRASRAPARWVAAWAAA
jgi:hypothetical protein